MKGQRSRVKGQRMRTGPFVLLVFFVVMVFVTLSAAQPATESKGSVENGQRAYMKYGCYQCHGRSAQGSPSTGPRLGPASSPYPAFEAWVRHPRGEMPPYTTRVLSDGELADIYAFIRSRPKPADPSRLPR